MNRNVILIALHSLAITALLSCAMRPTYDISVAPGACRPNCISGKITNELGRPVPGAVVTLSAAALPNRVRATTNSNGEFTFVSLEPSNYAITITAFLYLKAKIKGIALSGGASLMVTATLKDDHSIVISGPDEPVIKLYDPSVGVVIHNDDNGFPRVENK